MRILGSENNVIINGDATEALKNHVQDASVDLIFADPPYNIGKDFNGRKDEWPDERSYLKWCYEWLELCIAKLKPSGSLYLMASTQSMPYFDIFLRERMHVLSRVVWCYDSSGVQAKKYYGSLYEPILFAVKDRSNYAFNSNDVLVEARTGARRKLMDYRKSVPRLYNAKKVPGNVWEFSRVRYRMDEYENHPAQKPVALLRRIIMASSNIGDTVLDPFSGTFTTSFVANSLDRKSIGIEIDAGYCSIGLRRVLGMLEHEGEPLERGRRSFSRKSAD
jgi:site-specific DNA-methyltransferase (adenine-specific)